MKNVFVLAVCLVSVFATAAKNPFPVLFSCNLILYDVPGGATVASDRKEVVLPAFQMSPSKDLLLVGTRHGKTYVFSGNALRGNGTDHMVIRLNKFVGDKEVELAYSVASSDPRLEPGASGNCVYSILEGNDRIGYFACGMYVRPAE